MSLSMSGPQLGLVGSGMIVEDQIGPALAQLVCRGELEKVGIAAQGSGSLRKLLGLSTWQTRFPDLPKDWVQTYPDLGLDPAERNPEFYKQMFDAMAPGSIAMIATPDSSHTHLIIEALERGFHVVTVKSLCTTYADTVRIRDLAHRKGLFVGIDFHKRWDYRALAIRGYWKSLRFGTPRAGRATMIESDPYILAGSPFANHFTPETSDPASYVGCHYVDQVGWWTGKRPRYVATSGVIDSFQAGTPCYSWAASLLTYDDFVFTLTNGLQHAGHHRGRNHQGIEIWGASDDGHGTYLCHLDSLRGMDYAFDLTNSPGRSTDGGSDYVGFVPRSNCRPGEEMVGYGFRAIECLVRTALQVQNAGATEQRKKLLDRIDGEDLIPTATNTAYLGLVYEAMRKSVRHNGFPVEIDYTAGATNFRQAPSNAS